MSRVTAETLGIQVVDDETVTLTKAQNTLTRATVTYQVTLVAGTFFACMVAIRDKYNSIFTDKGKNINFLLGSILLHSDKYRWLDQLVTSHTASHVIHKNIQPDQSVLVVQLLEDKEAKTTLPLSDLKALDPSITKLGNADITVRRLALTDFTHPHVPPLDYVASVHRLYNEDFHNIKNRLVYFHCKAGVNRSFKTATIIMAISQLRQTKDPITLQGVLQTVWEICKTIKSERTCVDFKDENCLIQASFIACAVASYFLGADSYNKVNGFTAELLKYRIQDLIDEERPTRYTSHAARAADNPITQSLVTAIPKDQKNSARQKLIQDIKGDEVEYLEEDLQALKNGRTGQALAQIPEELHPQCYFVACNEAVLVEAVVELST
jgi:hypothetical protein